MSEERLERIEAALDNQVALNAELRTSTQQLRATAEALLQTVQIHQQNFEVLTARHLQTEARLEEYQRATSAALERIGAVLDYLVRNSGNGQG
jgi:DNA repair exonuclease SbcCD ATPase subunit